MATTNATTMTTTAAAAAGAGAASGGRLRDRNSTVIKCACQPRTPAHCPTGFCYTTSSCYASFRATMSSSSSSSRTAVAELGCFSNRTEGHHELDRMQCRSKASKLRVRQQSVEQTLCCGHADLCNHQLVVKHRQRLANLSRQQQQQQQQLHSTSIAISEQQQQLHLISDQQLKVMSVIAGILLLILTMLSITSIVLCHRRRRGKLQQKLPAAVSSRLLPHSASVVSQMGKATVSATCTTDSSWAAALTSTSPTTNFDMSSGSGRGMPFLFDSSVANQVQLLHKVGQGRYGSVWSANYMGSRVAVKIFRSRDEPSFQRECHMYTSFPLGHRNILTFRASDLTSSEGCTQFWLISEYHQLGSLHDFLQRQPLTARVGLQLALGAACGLCYLHTEVRGLHSKPAIAHRDVKSRNILVKDDLTCCIADLGFAVVASGNNNQPPDLPPTSSRAGTKRYMPPELLNERFQWSDFNAYKAADVYSLGLVLWEIGSRILCNGCVQQYSLPYHEFVHADPSFEQMHRIVCELAMRPSIPVAWAGSDLMLCYQQLLRDCWHGNPNARLQALRVQLDLDIMLHRFVDSVAADAGSGAASCQPLLLPSSL